MSAPETIADIVADIRAQNQGLPEDSNALSPLVCDILRLADRIEAEAKREIEDAERRGNHAATKAICETIEKVGPLYDAESIGNAAKLREALEEALNHLQNAECKVGFLDEVREVENKIRIALSAPPRNCDMFATADEALEAHKAAFEEDNFKNGECKLGCPGCDDFPTKCEVRWLFATAKKGETDGSK